MKLKLALPLFSILVLAASTAQATIVSGTLPMSTYTYSCQFSTEVVIANMSAPGASSITVTAGTGNEAQSETSTSGSAEATASGINNTTQTCTYVYSLPSGGTYSYMATVSNN